MKRPRLDWSLIFLYTSILGILWSCANTGSPEGGPYDTTPPRLVGASPQQGATNVTGSRFVLKFDEFVKLSGQQEKLIISPASQTPARVTASGKNVYIRLEDSLLPNTTYSFYFDDAIVDNNEDNPLEQFSYTFSTGSTLDSMQISGVLLDARSLEPVAGAIIGAHFSSSVTDSTLAKTPFTYVSKTNKMGRFTMRGLKDSTYHIFALTDNDNNYLYNLPAEGIAFSSESYRTSKHDSVRTDTIKVDSIVRRDTLRRDSLVTYQHTYYAPSDVVLRYFINEPRAQRLLKHERRDSVLCRLEFASVLDSLPRVNCLDYPDEAQDKLFYSTADGQFVEYWLRDERLIVADSLRLAITYPKTDSLGQPTPQSDTLTFFRPTKPAASPRKAKEKFEDRSPFRLSLATTKGIRAQTPSDTLYLTTTLPVDVIADSLIRLEIMIDSLYQVAPISVRQHHLDRKRFELMFDKVYGQKYRVSIDSARLYSIYQHPADSIGIEGRTEAEAELGTLELKILGADSLLRVELLDKSGQTLMSDYTLSVAKSDSVIAQPDSLLGAFLASDSLTLRRDTLGMPIRRIVFRDLKPNEYFVRAYVDRNADGQWTTGRYPDREPELMYYSHEVYAIKKGFTTSEQWSPTARSLAEQKPESLRKVKPEEKRRREDKNIEYYRRMGQKKKRK